MDQLMKHFNIPIEIMLKSKNLLVYLNGYDKVIREIKLSQMLAPSPCSLNGFLHHTIELCHTPKTLFAIHKSFYECNCGTAWPYCMKGMFMYPRSNVPVYLSNWSSK